MSGFERALNSDAWTDAEETPFPDDFTADETAFASELREFFALERDELPPLYVQTLLPRERDAAAECGFESKVIYRVFRRLSLPRPHLFEGSPLHLMLLAMKESLALISRPVLSGMTAAMLFMALTVALASPSFAAGLRILLGHTGVQQVTSYPNPSDIMEIRPEPLSRDSQAMPLQHMPLYWLGASFGRYAYVKMRATNKEFTNGPMVELSYMLSGHVRGTGKLDIREFLISPNLSAVLQTVETGSAVAVKIGNLKGVYVDGHWVQHGKRSVWQTGQKSELIFEYGDMIFWIVADQRDGIGLNQLIAVARGLVPATLPALGQLADPHRPAKPEQGSPWIAVDDEVLEYVRAGISPDSGQGEFVKQTDESP